MIPGRVDIEERPAVVEEKSRIGDWEADTIIGAGHQGALVSLVDRASKYTLLQQVPQKTATAVSAAIAQCLLPFVMLVHTITADNGKEFAGHQSLAQLLGTLFFFARPYHSWERGLNRAYPVVTHTHYMYGVATSGSGGGRSGDGCFAAARPFVWGLHT